MLSGILNWFKSFLQKSESRWDIYHPRERVIYHYWDGEKVVHADPQVLWSKVMEKGPELSVESKLSRSPSKDAPQAYKNLVERIRKIFNLKSFEEGGLTEGETEYLLDHFLGYCDEIKKNSSPSPTSPTGTSDTSGPSSGGGPPTRSSSDFGSTGTGSSTGGPGPLPSGPPSPTV